MAVVTELLAPNDAVLELVNDDAVDDRLIHTITPLPYWRKGQELLVTCNNRGGVTKSIQIVTRTAINGGNIELANGTRFWSGNVYSASAAMCMIVLRWMGTYWQEITRSANYPG